MIKSIQTQDKRFPIGSNAGSDAIHRNPTYSYAVTQLVDSSGHYGTGLAFTLGEGNNLVCQAAEFLSKSLQGKDIEDVMAGFGAWQNAISNEQQFRWLGPHKGVVHLALASVTNACWDLWAKKRGLPLWKLLLELDDYALLKTIDFSYLDDVLTEEEALALLTQSRSSRNERQSILDTGYPGYDTSIGWFNYSDSEVKDNVKRSVQAGFTAMKLKVGDKNMDRDLRRAAIVREAAGEKATVMVDCNQQWTMPQAIAFGEKSHDLNLYWIEEPTHPDDLLGHAKLKTVYGQTKVAVGEHIPNRIVFKNYLQSKAMDICQVDAVRVAGVSEFLAISMMSRKFDIPVIPHVGDMGQIHQHLVLFNHIGLGHPALMLEHIPHLQEHFIHPCNVKSGVYHIPQDIGMSSDLKD